MFSRVETSDPGKPRSNAFGLVQRELDERTIIVAVEGELDLSTAPRLKWMLVDGLETGHGKLILDLSRTTFMDSTALGVLVGIRRRLAGEQRLTVVCARPDVLKIFEYSGMDGAFEIFPTVEDAVASARGDTARAR
jgi:anti-sigma B factor antagonist